ncbi:hypothetical protein SNEBB_002663 [Seison nebaliae]|nr:hypothetical protein SNEBB_002663 [Seison nebaliae]
MVEHSQKTGKTDNDAADIIRRVGFRFRAHDALEELKEQLEIIDLRNDSEYIKNLMEALNSFSMFTRNFSSNISVKKSTILLTNDVLLRLWSLFNDIDKDRDLKELYGEKQTNRMIRLISDESYQIIRSSFPQFMFLMKGSKNGICRRILQLLNFIKDFSLRNYEEISKYLHRIDLNIFKELLTKVNFNETKDCRYETIIFLLSFMKNELLEKNEIFRMIIVEDLWYRSQFDKLETIHLILENLMKRLPNSLPFFYADQKLFKKFLSKILQLICWRGPVKFQQMQNLNIKKISLISHILYNYNKISENFCLENNPEIDGRTRIIERNTILKLIEQSIFSIIHQTNNEHRFDVLIWLIEEGLPPVMWKKIDENLFVFYNEIIKSILIKVNLVNVELSCKVLKGLYKREYENEWLNLLGELYSSKSFQIIDDGHLDIGLIVRKNYLYQMKISPQLIQIIGKYLRDRYLTPILSSHTNPLRQWKHLDWLIKEFDVNQMDFPIILQIIFDYSINYKTESEVNVKMKNHLDFIIQYIEDDEKLTRLDSISICQIIILLKKFDSITLHCLHEKFSHFIIDRSRKKENYDNIIFINLFNFLINEKLDNNLHFNPYSMTNDDEMVKYFIFFSFSFFYKKKELEMEYKMRIIEQLWVVVMSPFNIKSNLIKQMEKYLLTGTWNNFNQSTKSLHYYLPTIQF